MFYVVCYFWLFVTQVKGDYLDERCGKGQEPSRKETERADVPARISVCCWLEAAVWVVAALNREWLLLLPTSDNFRLFQRELLPSAPITEPLKRTSLFSQVTCWYYNKFMETQFTITQKYEVDNF